MSLHAHSSMTGVGLEGHDMAMPMIAHLAPEAGIKTLRQSYGNPGESVNRSAFSNATSLPAEVMFFHRTNPGFDNAGD